MAASNLLHVPLYMPAVTKGQCLGSTKMILRIWYSLGHTTIYQLPKSHCDLHLY